MRADAGGTERWAVNAVAMTAMGGAIAEVLLLGNTCEGHWADSEKIERLIPNDDRRKFKLADMTCVLVQRHRNSVELVANMLLTRRTLDGREIDRLCEMSRHAR